MVFNEPTSARTRPQVLGLMRPASRGITGLGASTAGETTWEPVISGTLGIVEAGIGSDGLACSTWLGNASLRCVATLAAGRVPNTGSSKVARSGRVETTRTVIIMLTATIAIKNAKRIIIEPTSHRVA
jgi:hypothetical protein